MTTHNIISFLQRPDTCIITWANEISIVSNRLKHTFFLSHLFLLFPFSKHAFVCGSSDPVIDFFLLRFPCTSGQHNWLASGLRGKLDFTRQRITTNGSCGCSSQLHCSTVQLSLLPHSVLTPLKYTSSSWRMRATFKSLPSRGKKCFCISYNPPFKTSKPQVRLNNVLK